MNTTAFSAQLSSAGSAQPVRRRFRPADLAEHLDWPGIGHLCLGITFPVYSKLLGEVFAQASGSFGLLLQALEAGHAEAIRQPAHSFKGEVSTVGLHSLAALALRLEQQGADFEPADCQAAAVELQACWDTVNALCLRMGLINMVPA